MSNSGRYQAVCQTCGWESPVTTWDKEAETDKDGHTAPWSNPEHVVEVVEL